MSDFRFDKNYKNLEQARPFMGAYMARYEELRSAGQYPYNDSFKGHLGITSGDEDTAIYLCQVLRAKDELAAIVAAKLADGYVPMDAVTEPVKCAAVFYYGWDMNGTSHKEWADVRLVPGLTDRPAVLPKRARTRGYHLLGGHVLAKVA